MDMSINNKKELVNQLETFEKPCFIVVNFSQTRAKIGWVGTSEMAQKGVKVSSFVANRRTNTGF
jgi:hypothetical protein